MRAVHLANFRVAHSCDALDPWIRKDLEGFATVDIDDYLEYILGRCLQPGKAVEQSGTPLLEAVYQKVIAALELEEHKAETGRIRFSLRD